MACIAVVVAGAAEPPEPTIDVDAVIERSYKILPAREPELTDIEAGMYDKIMPMIRTRRELAIRLLEGLVADEETSAAFDFLLGSLYFDSEDFESAETRYRTAVEKYPDFIRAWDSLGVLYFTRQRYAEAVPCFNKVVALGSWEARIFGLLGFCLAKSGSPTAAELAYGQACALEPQNADWLDGLIAMTMETRQWARAESLLEQLVRVAPNEGRRWMTLANVILAQDRQIDAIAPLEVADRLGVLPTDGLQLLGDLYVTGGFHADAARIYEKMGTADLGISTERMLKVVRALEARGDLSQAARLLERVAGDIPDGARVEFYMTRAGLAAAQGRRAEARNDLGSLLEIDPMHGAALMELGRLHLLDEDPDRALMAFEHAAHVPAVAFQANVQLTRLYAGRRDYGRALASLDEAIKLDESTPLLELRAQLRSLNEAQRPATSTP